VQAGLSANKGARDVLLFSSLLFSSLLFSSLLFSSLLSKANESDRRLKAAYLSGSHLKKVSEINFLKRILNFITRDKKVSFASHLCAREIRCNPRVALSSLFALRRISRVKAVCESSPSATRSERCPSLLRLLRLRRRDAKANSAHKKVSFTYPRYKAFGTFRRRRTLEVA
jgi:hypothetical protein